MAKLNLVSLEWTDLVFEGRNQNYGAYQLRKETSKRNIWSIIFVVLLAILLYLGLTLENMVEAHRTVENTQIVEVTNLRDKKKEVKVERKEEIKLEPERIVEKVKSSIKFTAPVIKKDQLKSRIVTKPLVLLPLKVMTKWVVRCSRSRKRLPSPSLRSTKKTTRCSR